MTPALRMLTVEKVVDTDAHEGPVYVADEDALYFTSLPRPSETGDYPMVEIRRVQLDGQSLPLPPTAVTTVPTDTVTANGMTLDRDGALLVCEQGSATSPARISRLDRVTRRTATVVDAWRGLPLNSPNDVVVKSDGTIWFTDPSYGHLQGFRPAPQVGDHVYRFDPRSGELAVVADSFDKPNGLAFAPDERVLYVGDSGANHEPGSYDVRRPHHVIAYDVALGGHLTNGRLFAAVSPGFPDGIKVDGSGWVYVSCASGVQVFTSGGDMIGEIDLPGAVNFTFGGPDGSALFITADAAIWVADLGATAR